MSGDCVECGGDCKRFECTIYKAWHNEPTKPYGHKMTANPNEVQPCMCGNTYLSIRTDIYKGKREFIYCDCCGAMATRTLWQSSATSDAAGQMAIEYQAWIDFYHRGNGSYGDFLKSHAAIAARGERV